MNTAMAIRVASMAVVAMSTIAFPNLARGDVYRCVLLSGETEYQSQPCSEGTLEKILDDRDTRKARADAEGRAKQLQTENEQFRLGEEERITRWQRDSAPPALQVRHERLDQSAAPNNVNATCDSLWARSVRAYAAQAALIQELGEHAVYSFHAQSWPTIRPQVPQLVRAATNADICLTGRVRRIDYYAPDGTPVGFSDPRHGTSVIN